jgi:clan AA aspartic protease
MSTFYEEITLENSRDAGNAVEGLMKPQDVRKTSVKAYVDTGAWTLIMGENTCKKLGLHITGQHTSDTVNGAKVEGYITEPVTVYWKNRHAACEAMVLSDEKDVILGAYPLEGMDVMIDPKNECIVGKHGDQPRGRIGTVHR